MLELFRLVLGTVRVSCGGRRALVLENLMLRHQLAVALRPRRRPRLERRDTLFWLLLCRFTTEWRRHLVLVSPDTVVRWHRQGGASSGAGHHGRGSGVPTSRPRSVS